MRKYASSINLRSLSLCAVILLASSVLAAAQHERVLYSFGTNSGDGVQPGSTLIADSAGNLYGNTPLGGANNGGTIFELSPPVLPGANWTETILYSFGGDGAGNGAAGALVFDGVGNLYGTSGGGDPNCGTEGCGIVFELSPPSVQGGSWTITTLYTFIGGNDGEQPEAGLIFDQSGNLYGTTIYGGGGGTCGVPLGFSGCGTVFELSPPAADGGLWTESVLYSFTGGDDVPRPRLQWSLTRQETYMARQRGAACCASSLGAEWLLNWHHPMVDHGRRR